jgi:hypothetical protein
MNWKESFKDGKEIIISTSSKNGKPNANIVISKGFNKGKLFFADCQMKNTIKNLKENKIICIIGGYYRINGTVNIFNKGYYFDKYNNDEKYPAKNIIRVTIREVFDLDKVKVIRKF